MKQNMHTKISNGNLQRVSPLNMHMHALTHVCMHAGRQAHPCTCTQTCTHNHTHAHTHKHTHTHTYTHTQTNTKSSNFSLIIQLLLHPNKPPFNHHTHVFETEKTPHVQTLT